MKVDDPDACRNWMCERCLFGSVVAATNVVVGQDDDVSSVQVVSNTVR